MAEGRSVKFYYLGVPGFIVENIMINVITKEKRENIYEEKD